MSIILNGERVGYPELSFLSFDLYGLLEHVREQFPNQKWRRIGVWIQAQPTLACIWFRDDSADVILHSVLNHRQTPEAVVRYILKHELLHLQVPAREVDGKLTSHPPEFREAESMVAPEQTIAMNWLYIAIGSYLSTNKRRERITVKRGWKHSLNGGRVSLEWVEKFLRRGDRPAEGQVI